MSPGSPAPELEVRRATEADGPAIAELCRATLGWVEGEPFDELFAWKHDRNPFGTSPRWVAVTGDGDVVGLRVFMRWGFVAPDGSRLAAVRAVDTATHPDHQGRGLFRRLTLGALPDLRGDGVDLVFNTPNDKSRPGYLKMGWSEVGRVAVGVRLGGLRRLPAMAGARTAAELWSEPSSAGLDAADVLAETAAVDRLLAALAAPAGIRTDRSADYLRWRYSFEPLRYRAVLVGRDIEDGLVLFRVRRRGAARECAVTEVLVPPGRSVGPTMARVARESDADYLLRAGAAPLREGFLPAPALGPVLTWRPVGRPGVPRLGDLALALGDLELF